MPYFRENNNFYGKYDVKIVSRAQQIGTLQLSTKKHGYKTAPKSGIISSMKKTLGLSKPPTRKALPKELARKIGTYLMPAGVEPKSPAALATRAEKAKGGARKSRTKKRVARKTQKRKSKRRRTMKRK